MKIYYATISLLWALFAIAYMVIIMLVFVQSGVFWELWAVIPFYGFLLCMTYSLDKLKTICKNEEVNNEKNQYRRFGD